MLKRRAIQVVRHAGHTLDEIVVLVAVGKRTVQRVSGEPMITDQTNGVPDQEASRREAVMESGVGGNPSSGQWSRPSRSHPSDPLVLSRARSNSSIDARAPGMARLLVSFMSFTWVQMEMSCTSGRPPSLPTGPAYGAAGAAWNRGGDGAHYTGGRHSRVRPPERRRKKTGALFTRGLDPRVLG